MILNTESYLKIVLCMSVYLLVNVLCEYAKQCTQK